MSQRSRPSLHKNWSSVSKCAVFHAAASAELILNQALHEELAGMEQGEVDTTTLSGVAKDLIAPTLLLHKVCLYVSLRHCAELSENRIEL